MDRNEQFQQVSSSARSPFVDDKLASSFAGNRISGQTMTPNKPVDDISDEKSFLAFRFKYLIVILVIMLADGLQGKCSHHVKKPPSHRTLTLVVTRLFPIQVLIYMCFMRVMDTRLPPSIAWDF